MRFTLATFATFSTSVLAIQGFMSDDFLFANEGSLSKRQSGYYPPGAGTTCRGPGNTCQTACGATFTECPYTGGRGLCFQPASGSTCCVGTGRTCNPGYYCTRDKEGTPYCCTQNLNAEECAKQFGLDGPLTPDPTGTPSAVPSPSNPPSPPSASPPSTPSSPPPPPPPSTTPSTTPSAISSTTEKPPVVSTQPVLPSIPVLESSSTSKTLVSNVTSTSRTLPQFTGGAAVMRVAGQGAVMLAGAAGWVML